MNQKQRIDSAIREAKYLLSKSDGKHNMHSCWSNIVCWKRLMEDNMDVDWDNVELILKKMRFTVHNGRFPNEKEI